VSDPLPLSVWATAQQLPRQQRAGRYVPASTAHPAKMLPAVAATAIAAYTQPGELVVDPMCGIGTTLVEAVYQGRQAIGVEYEHRWAALARANLTLAAGQGATGTGQVHTGDARQLLGLVDPALRGTAALVLTSPPYGQSVHGQVSARPGQGIAKSHDCYSTDPANLARSTHPTLLAALEKILAASRELLRPGGMVVLTARPWRRQGLLVDFPGQLTRTADAAGLVAYERNVALLVGLRDDRLVPRPSFFQLDRVRKARARGMPLRVIAHEDVLAFRRPPTPAAPLDAELARPFPEQPRSGAG
jgi:modification methylase